jgi:hypothetical protein
VPRATAPPNPIRCAGERAKPCVIEQVVGDQARYSQLWPMSGEIAKHPIAEVAIGPRQHRNHAVSPDGETLALVDGRAVVRLVELDTGKPRDLVVGGGIEIQSVSWSRDGRAVFVTGILYRGHNFAALRVGLDGEVTPIELGWDLWCWRIHEHRDGRLATIGLQLQFDVAMLEGL